HPGDEGPQHVERAVGEVDDVEQAEDDGQPQREHGVERAVDQAEQELAEQGLDGNTEKLCHRAAAESGGRGVADRGSPPVGGIRSSCAAYLSAQVEVDSAPNTDSAGRVRTML